MSAELLRATMDFLIQRLQEGKPNETMRVERLAWEVEEKLSELYEQCQRSACSSGYMAEQLGITAWDLYALLERRGLRTTNL